MDRPNYYAVIPAYILFDKNIKNNSKILFGIISSLLNMNNKCFATDEYFAKVLDTSESSIQRWLKELERNGFITRTSICNEKDRKIKTRYISICDTICSNMSKSSNSQKRQDHIVKNEQYNSNLTDSNNNPTDSKKINKKDFISHAEFAEIYKLYNPTCRVIPDINSISFKRVNKAVKALGDTNTLKNAIKAYLDHLKHEQWKNKKGFDAFFNSPEHYGKDWSSEIKDIRKDMPL